MLTSHVFLDSQVEDLKQELCELNNDLEQVTQEVLLANSTIKEKDMEITKLRLKVYGTTMPFAVNALQSDSMSNMKYLVKLHLY